MNKQEAAKLRARYHAEHKKLPVDPEIGLEEARQFVHHAVDALYGCEDGGRAGKIRRALEYLEMDLDDERNLGTS